MPIHTCSRQGSKSFVGQTVAACFDTLPNELILDILEYVALDRKTTLALATVCKRISKLVDFLLYRTVILPSHESISLLFSTVQSRPSSFFATHVKKIAVTCPLDTRPHYSLGGQIQIGRKIIQSQLTQIIGVCSGVRALIMPTRPTFLKSNNGSSPSQITIGSCAEIAPEPLTYSSRPLNASLAEKDKSFFQKVTHLRLGDPSDGWYSPSSTLKSFGPLPLLTHLQLSRRANANPDNDDIFVEDIREMLQSRAGLELLVATIYPPTRTCCRNGNRGFKLLPYSDQDSNIWTSLHQLSREDSRLVVAGGIWDGWSREWEDPAVLATDSPSLDFWSSVQKTRSSQMLKSERL